MNANQLIEWFEGRILYLWDAEDGQYYDSAIADELVPMLRQQQAEIEALKADLVKLQLKPYQYQAGNDILCGQIHNPLYRNQQQGQVKQGYGAEFEEWIGKAQET